MTNFDPAAQAAVDARPETVLYRIRPGNIPAVVYVDIHGQDEQCFIYTAPDKQPEPDPIGAQAGRLYELLPMEVRAQINRHFGNAFALPVERRGVFMKMCQPWEVIAEAYPAQSALGFGSTKGARP
jgi:hypothetical protein